MKKNKLNNFSHNKQHQRTCSRSRKKNKKNWWKESRWKELCNEAADRFKRGDYQKAIHHYNNVILFCIFLFQFNSLSVLTAH